LSATLRFPPVLYLKKMPPRSKPRASDAVAVMPSRDGVSPGSGT
jgi:hypothetical protein